MNYTGGKYKILNQIISIFPKNLDLFVDLFSGGFNVGINAKRIVCVDKQKEIIRVMNLFKKYENGYIMDNVEKILDGYQLYNCISDKGLGFYNKNKYI